MEYKFWKWTLNTALVLAILFISLCDGGSATKLEPPIIEVVEGVTNSSVIKFYNGTLLVVAKEVASIVLRCNGSYPVMWTLDSLEQRWTSGTGSYRLVTNFKDKSTYTYSMSVGLANKEEDDSADDHTQVSLKPEEYVCHAAAGADLSSGLVSRLVVVWEAKKIIWGEYEAHTIYWGPNRDSAEEILVPCFTVNVNDTVVELYRKSNKTRTLLATEAPGRPLKSPTIRFEKYTGFFLKPSEVTEADEQVFECRVQDQNDIVETSSTSPETTTSTTTTVRGSVETSTNKSHKADSADNDEEEDEDHDYKYISSEDVLVHGENVTSTADEHDDDDPHVFKLMIRLIRRNSTDANPTRKPEQESDTLQTYLDRKNPNLKLERTNKTAVSCCVEHEDEDGSYTADNMVLYHKFCYEPLICLTKSHLLKKTYLFYWAKDDKELSSKCRYINTTDVYRARFDFRPTLYICHMRTDLRHTRREYNGDYYLSHHLETSENSYLLDAVNRSTYTDQEYYNIDKIEYVNDFSNATFYHDQPAKFRCTASEFFYASGHVWELHWRNGTSKLLLPQDRGKEELGSLLQLNVTTELVRLSCHFPPWNSTEWVTKSAEIKVEQTKPPSSATGLSYLAESVEFFAGESRVLSCALDGYPPPKYAWTITSSGYTLLERTPRYYYLYDYHDTPQYAGQSPSYHTEPKIQNVTISVSTYYTQTNTTAPIPVGAVTCEATNLAGNGLIRFRIQAKRPQLPQLGFEGRGLSRVFFVNDQAKPLNCSLKKGLPQAVIYWQKYDMNISNSEHYEIQESGNSSALVFKSSIDFEDEGDYRCIAANLAGNATLVFRVRIRESSSHARHPWYEFGLVALVVVVIALISAFAYIYVRKSKKISRLEMRAEYSKAFGDHESSRLTVATDF